MVPSSKSLFELEVLKLPMPWPLLLLLLLKHEESFLHFVTVELERYKKNFFKKKRRVDPVKCFLRRFVSKFFLFSSKTQKSQYSKKLDYTHTHSLQRRLPMIQLYLLHLCSSLTYAFIFSDVSFQNTHTHTHTFSSLPKSQYSKLHTHTHTHSHKKEMKAIFIQLLSLTSLFILSNLFFSRFIFSNFTSRASVKGLFCATFSIGSNLFVLLLCEIMNLLESTMCWKVNLLCMCVLVTFVLPQYTIKTLIESSNLTRSIGVSGTNVSAMSIFLFGFWRLGANLPSNNKSSSTETTTWLDKIPLSFFIQRIGILGVTAISFLSGFRRCTIRTRNYLSSHYPSRQVVFNVAKRY